MIVIPVLSPLLAAAGKEVASWSDCGSRLRVQAVSTRSSAACPACGARSSRRHGLLWRTLADCPSFGQAVGLARNELAIALKCAVYNARRLVMLDQAGVECS
jgi:hypothetical protein